MNNNENKNERNGSDDDTIVDHCWLIRWGVLVVAYKKRICFYRNFVEIQELKAVERLEVKGNEEEVNISALGHTNRGIFVGYENYDQMSVYDLDKND